jgi:hypothetical protein
MAEFSFSNCVDVRFCSFYQRAKNNEKRNINVSDARFSDKLRQAQRLNIRRRAYGIGACFLACASEAERTQRSQVMNFPRREQPICCGSDGKPMTTATWFEGEPSVPLRTDVTW